MKLTMAIIGAALLTILLSPTNRAAALQRVFNRDFPLTPYDFEPKYWIFKNGVRIA